jgi:hypothetical protein
MRRRQRGQRPGRGSGGFVSPGGGLRPDQQRGCTAIGMNSYSSVALSLNPLRLARTRVVRVGLNLLWAVNDINDYECA